MDADRHRNDAQACKGRMGLGARRLRLAADAAGTLGSKQHGRGLKDTRLLC
jgi:hypothetical protein